MQKMKVGIVGATGMVGQRIVTRLHNHPWFEIAQVSASKNSAGKNYEDAVSGRWHMPEPIPGNVRNLVVQNANNVKINTDGVDFVFCALDMPKKEIATLEESYAKAETPVISNNSAHRWTQDVPMILPEVNPGHSEVIVVQRRRLKTENGFTAVKPNCSIQLFVPPLHALKEFRLHKVSVCTYQALSGAGKTFETWPEMVDNIIPFIKGEEDKSEKEPMKIWGKLSSSGIMVAVEPIISAQCIRVPVSDGHMAAVSVEFDRFDGSLVCQDIIDRWRNFSSCPQKYKLPSAPIPPLIYFEEENRPQTKLDRDRGNGMAISIGRLRRDSVHHFKFVCLSHNTIRGAAGGAILMAELLKAQGYLSLK